MFKVLIYKNNDYMYILGFPPEFRDTVCVRKLSGFFSISIMEKVPEIQNFEAISETIFSRYPEVSGTLFWYY